MAREEEGSVPSALLCLDGRRQHLQSVMPHFLTSRGISHRSLSERTMPLDALSQLSVSTPFQLLDAKLYRKRAAVQETGTTGREEARQAGRAQARCRQLQPVPARDVSPADPLPCFVSLLPRSSSSLHLFCPSPRRISLFTGITSSLSFTFRLF